MYPKLINTAGRILFLGLVLCFLAACSSAANTTKAPTSEGAAELSTPEEVAKPAASEEIAEPYTSGEVVEPATSEEVAEPSNSKEPAESSNQGDPGEMMGMTGDVTAGTTIFTLKCQQCHGYQGEGGVENPGSTDGTVPPLNPIDAALVSSDDQTFAANIDKFIQHGSTPEGDNPEKVMPAFGDEKLLTPQMISNVIAYVISLNKE